MLEVTVEGNAVRIGTHFTVNFQRTLRLPDDGGSYPLPPSLGQFPVKQVADYAGRVPDDWRERGGVFIPMYQREAMWLNFLGDSWHPVAAKIGVGRVNALTGKRWDERLHADPQDYLVCPTQPWLDGINAGDGVVRQFVAMPLGGGYTVEGQVTSEEVFGGLQIIVFDAKPGRFPEEPPPSLMRARGFAEGVAMPAAPMAAMAKAEGGAMGLAAGGKMRQAIYPDPHGVATWDERNRGEVVVHIVNSDLYREITGQDPPPTPVDARAYTQHGYPWFALYDEERGRLAPSETLAKVKSVREIDREKDLPPQQDDTSVAVPEEQIRKIDPKRRRFWERDRDR
jgi:hypothetical protein